MSTKQADPYGFGGEPEASITLPKKTGKAKTKPDASVVEQATSAGKNLGFVSRQASTKRKPGPKRTEPQGQLTLTGPQRIIDRLRARCDAMGGVPYWHAIEIMLDETEGQE